MLTLPILTRPSYSLASSSRIGATILQGPHHSAQKSTRTGVVDLRTSASKFAVVRVRIVEEAIGKIIKSSSQRGRCSTRRKMIAPLFESEQHENANHGTDCQNRGGDG